MAGERKARQALGDIGNLVTIRGVNGKEIPQVSRPVTRRFCAQLLANAQNAAAEKNKKVNGAMVPVKKPVQKKSVIVKHKPEEIIEISPDTVEVAVKEKRFINEDVIEISPDTIEVADKEKQFIEEEKSGKKSIRKKAPTLTSRLTARSQAVCGLISKQKEHIVDIDAADVNNELSVVEYLEDMYTYYKSAENECRAHDYMYSQPELNEKMRTILIDWLVQVHQKFDLSPETLYLTINILDRYLAIKTTSRRELQLVGVSAMHIASKYEEIWAPEVDDLVHIADRTYSHKQLLVMEKQILGELEWNLTVPTPYVFLVRFIKASMTESDVEHMVYFLAELGMMNYDTIVYCPSMFAASAVYAARSTLNKVPVWNDTLKKHTGFSETELLDCAKLLVGFHANAMAADYKYRSIFRKYLSTDRQAVSLLPPAKSLLAA